MIVFNDESRQENDLFQYKHKKLFNEFIVQRFPSFKFQTNTIHSSIWLLLNKLKNSKFK